MAVEVIEKKKRGLTCGECDATVSKGMTECDECGSENIKKSLVVVRKSVADEEAELETEVDETEDDEDDEDDEEILMELDEEDEEDEDDDDDEEDDEDDEEDDDEAPVTKSNSSLVGLEALNIATALAEDITKVFAAGKKPSRKAYEQTMTEVNNVMDAAADRWFAGSTVSKSKKKAPHVSAIQGRVNGIINKTEGKKMARPDGLDLSKLDEGTRKYIEELEGGTVEKNHDPYKDLPEEVKKSLKAADKIVEEREQEKWLGVAKSYSHFTGDTEELAKTLRGLSEKAPEEFETLKKSLDAAEENLAQSEVFKSFGAPGGGETKDDKKEAAISKALEAHPEWTRERAEVEMMDGSAYQPTA